MTAFFAFLFSLAAPGAGHIFIGSYTEGFVLGGLFAVGKSALLPLMLRAFQITDLKRTLQFFYVCNCCYIALILYAAVSSLWRGFYAQQAHFLYAIAFAVCITIVYKNTLNAFVFTALCGRSGVYALLHNKRKAPTEKK